MPSTTNWNRILRRLFLPRQVGGIARPLPSYLLDFDVSILLIGHGGSD